MELGGKRGTARKTRQGATLRSEVAKLPICMLAGAAERERGGRQEAGRGEWEVEREGHAENMREKEEWRQHELPCKFKRNSME